MNDADVKKQSEELQRANLEGRRPNIPSWGKPVEATPQPIVPNRGPEPVEADDHDYGKNPPAGTPHPQKHEPFGSGPFVRGANPIDKRPDVSIPFLDLFGEDD